MQLKSMGAYADTQLTMWCPRRVLSGVDHKGHNSMSDLTARGDEELLSTADKISFRYRPDGVLATRDFSWFCCDRVSQFYFHYLVIAHLPILTKVVTFQIWLVQARILRQWSPRSIARGQTPV